MINWFTSARFELFVPIDGEEYAAPALLRALRDRLQRQHPQEATIEGATLNFRGPIAPKFRGPPNLHGVRWLRAVVEPNGDAAVRVCVELEMRTPLHILAMVLVQGVFLSGALGYVGALVSPTDWALMALGVLAAAVVAGSLVRVLVIFFAKYHVDCAADSVRGDQT